MVSREIAGEVILVPIRNNVGDLESIYTLNETAGFVWERLDGEHTLSDIRDAMVADFDVTPGEAASDLLELIEQFAQLGAIRQVP